MGFTFTQNKNCAISTLYATLPIGGTSITLYPGEGALFPTSGSWYGVIWEAAHNTPSADATREYILVTSRTSDTLTIVRAQEGTSAKEWTLGSHIALIDSAAKWTELQTIINSIVDNDTIFAGENTFTNNLKIKGDAFRLRLLDDGSGGKEFSLCSDNGAVSLNENTGSENSPNWVPRLVVAPDYVTGGVPVRKCVLRAVLDSNGRNNAISAGTGLAVNLAATSTPFVVTVPYGFDDFGRPVDYLRKETADITGAWSGLTNNATNYLYYKRTNAGVWSRGFTTLAPAFGYGTAERPSSPSNGQLYFDITKWKWDLYTTSWAEQTDTYVFVGQCETVGGAVTSVVNYAINGKHDSGIIAVSLPLTITINHNIGAPCDYAIWESYTGSQPVWKLLHGFYQRPDGPGIGLITQATTGGSIASNITTSFATGNYLGHIVGTAYSVGNIRVKFWRSF